MTRFRNNFVKHEADTDIKMITGKDQTVPNQSASITEVIYRFQGGIIPTLHNPIYDPEQDNEEFIDARNIAGFDITDAFQLLQTGKKEYQNYINEKKATLKEEANKRELEFKRLQSIETEYKQLKEIQNNGNNL